MGFRFFNLCSISKLDPLRKSSSRHRPIHPSISTTTLLFHSLNPHFQDHHPPPITSPRYHIPKRWHFGHSHADHHHDHPSSAKAENIFRLGLAADIGLATGKAFTGYLSGSTAIIADAAHSVSDVVLSGVALWSFKAGQAPKDKEHPYGHSKFESLGALGISCMLLATAGGIAWHALDILVGFLSTSPEAVNHSLSQDHTPGHTHGGHHHGFDMQHPVLALSMTVVSISVKEGLYWVTKIAGDKQGSGLMKANAWHHRADAVSSVVTLIGVGGSLLGVRFLDPLAGIIVSGMILKAGLETGYQSILELVDAAIPSEELDPLRKTISEVEGVKGCHRLRGRRAGSSIYLDVHIEVDPFLSVSAAHGIGESVRQEIHKSHPLIAEVFIHIDPAFLRLSPSMMKQQQDNRGGMAHRNTSSSLDEKDIEFIVSNIFSTKFPEKIAVERITHHLLQGKILLQIEVSMAPDVLIRDAREVAEEAEKEILKAASDIIQVNFELRLGRPIPKFNCEE